MKKKSILWFTIALLLCSYVNISAINPQNSINEGNGLYKKGLYSQAAYKYQQVADSGYVAADLYYNLGNAYYKANDIKRAILYYEKAKLITPRDKELNHNLAMAQSKAIDKINNIPDLFFLEWVRNFRDQFAVDTWAAYSIAMFIFGLTGFLFYFLTYKIIFKKWGFWVGSSGIFISIITLLFAASSHNAQIKQRTAIIFVKGVTVKSTPSETGTNLFILHEGTKVKIIDKVEAWNKIKIPDGNQGWIKENDLAKI